MWLSSSKSFITNWFDKHVLIGNNFSMSRMSSIYNTKNDTFVSWNILYTQDFDQNKTIWLFDQIRCSMIQILASIYKWTYTTCIPYALVPYNEFVWVHHIDVFLKIPLVMVVLISLCIISQLRCAIMNERILIDLAWPLAKMFIHSWTISFLINCFTISLAIKVSTFSYISLFL